MFVRQHHVRFAALFVGLMTGAVAAGEPASPPVGTEVVLRLDDGRLPRGTLDAASDDMRIVIATEWPGVRMSSSFGRDRVREVLDAAAYDASLGNRLIVVVGDFAGLSDRRRPNAERSWSVAVRPRVMSLFVRAEVANWDGDAEPDGLLVQVVPLDELGRPVPTAGTLAVELHAQRLRTATRRTFLADERPFFEAERWSERLGVDGFGPEGTFVRLPFRQLQPERDFDVAAEGLVRARLVVPGVGTFDAEDANVRLRSRSRFRDELQQRTGERDVRSSFSRDP